MEEHIFPLSFAKEAAEAEIGSHAVERRLIQTQAATSHGIGRAV
jgi:hypothetical protein